MLEFAPHPLLEPTAIRTRYEGPLSEIPPSAELRALLEGDSDVPDAVRLDPERREAMRQEVRNLLRHGGHKPTGRGKPSSEYLVRAASEKGLPVINPSVDACNAVSLHTGLPISVVDLDRTRGQLSVAVCEEGSYVFNASGQEIRLNGLLCLFDERGPIANPVKDSHATKTSPETTRTLSVMWAPTQFAAYAAHAAVWYASVLASTGASEAVRI